MKVFLLWCKAGIYEDRREWVEAVYVDKGQADLHAERANAWAKAAFADIPHSDGFSDDPYKRRYLHVQSLVCPYGENPYAGCDSVEAEYCVAEYEVSVEASRPA